MADFLVVMQMIREVLDRFDGGFTPNHPPGFTPNQSRAAVIVQKLRDEGFIQIDAGGSGSAQGGDG